MGFPHATHSSRNPQNKEANITHPTPVLVVDCPGAYSTLSVLAL